MLPYFRGAKLEYYIYKCNSLIEDVDGSTFKISGIHLADEYLCLRLIEGRF